MTVFNDKLYSVYRDAADVITLTIYNGENWSQPVGIRGPANQLVRVRGTPAISRHGSERIVIWNDQEVPDALGAQVLDPATGKLQGKL